MIPTWILLAAGGALLGVGKQAPLRIALAKAIEIAKARQPSTPNPSPLPSPGPLPEPPLDITNPPTTAPDNAQRDKQAMQLQLLRIAEFGTRCGNPKLATQAFSLMKLLAEPIPTEATQ